MSVKPWILVSMAAIAAVTVSAGLAGASDDGKDLEDIVKGSDQMLAFQRFDLGKDGTEDAVAVVRHAEADANGNTCELLILQRAGSDWVVKERSGTVVDCLYNDVARNARDLSDNLTVKAGEITYVNQGVRDNVTFKLKYDGAKSMWFLAEASSTHPIEDTKTGKMTVVSGRRAILTTSR